MLHGSKELKRSRFLKWIKCNVAQNVQEVIAEKGPSSVKRIRLRTKGDYGNAVEKTVSRALPFRATAMAQTDFSTKFMAPKNLELIVVKAVRGRELLR